MVRVRLSVLISRKLGDLPSLPSIIHSHPHLRTHPQIIALITLCLAAVYFGILRLCYGSYSLSTVVRTYKERRQLEEVRLVFALDLIDHIQILE